MKTKVAFLLSAALLAGVLISAPTVFAQSPPPHPDFAAMRANMQQIDDLRKAERSQVLGVLSSSHRSYLASVVGQLAIAANPDPKAAAAQLDARLSSSEKTAILSADRSFHDQRRAKLAAFRPAGGPPHEHHGHRAPDAGRILLEVAGFGGHHGFGMHHA
jgi:hypothetical protein